MHAESSKTSHKMKGTINELKSELKSVVGKLKSQKVEYDDVKAINKAETMRK